MEPSQITHEYTESLEKHTFKFQAVWRPANLMGGPEYNKTNGDKVKGSGKEKTSLLGMHARRPQPMGERP